jgi:hypothetical protein
MMSGENRAKFVVVLFLKDKTEQDALLYARLENVHTNW